MKADRKKVRLAMERAHMTVHDVAKAADLPPQTTAAIICGMSVQRDTMLRIARALDVGMGDILQGAVPVPKTQHGACGDSAGEPPKLPAGQVRIDLKCFAEIQTRSGLSVRELADRAGVSPAVIRSIARGGAAHKAETVDKLADALGVTAYNIIKREGNS